MRGRCPECGPTAAPRPLMGSGLCAAHHEAARLRGVPKEIFVSINDALVAGDGPPPPWHPRYPDGCVSCGRTSVPHAAGGECRTCYRGKYARHGEKAAPAVVAAAAPEPHELPPAGDVVLPEPVATAETVSAAPAEPVAAVVPLPVPPALRGRHGERVTIFRFSCPNCTQPLAEPATGRAEFRDLAGDLVLVCTPVEAGGWGCGARWAITDETIATIG